MYEHAADAAAYEAAKSAFFTALVAVESEPPDLAPCDDGQAALG